MTFQQLCNGRFSPNLATKRSSVSRRCIQKDIFENFHFRGHLPPKSEIESQSNTHLTQSRQQATGCTTERYCLLHVVVQGPGNFQDQVNFSVQSTVADLRGVKVAQFSDFGQGLHPRMITIFPRGSRRSKEVPSGSGVFLRLLVGELTTPKLAQIFAYGKWLYPYIMLLHGASDLDQRCLKMRNFEEQMYFPNKYLHPYPQNHPTTQFCGTFQRKTYYTESSP